MADAPVQHAAGAHLSVADLRTEQSRVRSRIHRQLVAPTGLSDSAEDDPGRSQRDGGPVSFSARGRCVASWRLLQAGWPLVVLLLARASAAHAQSSSGPDAMTGAISTVIRPGDVVRLRIWREPDLSGEFTVDETGTVVLPKLGAVTITGA